MSLSSRATSKGGKGAKADKSHKTDKTESGKSGGDKQHKDKISKNEDSTINDKVKHLIEMTQRSEDEVCLVLYQCDYDMNQAVELLIEGGGTGEWETRVKKKKSRQASAGKQGDNKGPEDAPAVDDWNDGGPSGQTADVTSGGNNRGDKEKGRGGGNRSGGPPRLHGRGGWRGRERHENERNMEEGGRSDFRDRDRRGRSGGDSTRGRGGRGRGGGRGGRYPPRGNRSNNTYNKPIETWDNSNTWDNSTAITTNHNAEETWDDFPGADEWSTEEYTGSLADTKVFTPSTQPTLDQISEPPVGESTTLNDLQSSLGQPLGQSLQINQQSSVQLSSQSPVPQMVGSLTPAQTQYFSQLQQNNDPLNKQYGSTTQTFQSQSYEKSPSSSQYNNSGTASQGFSNQPYVNQNSGYVSATYQTVNNSYGQVQSEPTPAQQPSRTKTQRARVPPPSKIPASAVEMPGELNSSIGYLDVQFGAMDLIDANSSFDNTIDSTKFNNTQTNNLESSTSSTANLDLNSSNQNPNLDVYSPKTMTQSSISSALSQSLTNDNIPPTSEHLSNAYNSASRSTTQGNVSTVVSTGLDLNKPSETHSYSQTSSYNTYQSKSNTYNSSNYSGTQTTSSYVSNQANTYVNSQSGSYNPPSGNSYQNAYSSNNSYQSNTNSASFPSISQSTTYPSSNNQPYQQNTSQSVYGTNPGLNSGSSYGNASQYNNYSSSTKLVKDTYETNPSTTSSSQATTTHVTSSSSLSLSQTTVGNSKTSTTLAKSSNSIVSNIPPGVAPVMSTPYIMGQMQYFQQPVYSYEDMQLLQQRIPHMTTPFYDMSYQTPTTLATVRDAAALGSVGYSISDGRFTRTDNNASPVPSTLSQQTSTLTQGHQAQPILAAGTAPPYFFATAFNTIAPNYQFGAMYTQLPAATNAHGSSNSTQYPKPATYGSGYGSYDALNQSQDYTKSGYVGNTQTQKGTGANVSSTGSASDLAALYSKPHTALGKVNSYEKQGFHSGTPPPFTGAIHGSQNAGLAPSGTGYAPQVYIPTMAAQHHSTHLMQQPLHQMDVRHQSRRMETGNSGSQRSQASNQAKANAKQSYQASYWNQA